MQNNTIGTGIIVFLQNYALKGPISYNLWNLKNSL